MQVVKWVAVKRIGVVGKVEGWGAEGLLGITTITSHEFPHFSIYPTSHAPIIQYKAKVQYFKRGLG